MAKRPKSAERAKIEGWVADDVIPLRTTLAGKQVSGWMMKGQTTIAAGEERTRRFAGEAKRGGHRLFCGISRRMLPLNPVLDAIRLYVLDDVAETEIAEFCDVGVPFDYAYPEIIQYAIDTNPEGYKGFIDAIASGGWTVEELAGPPPAKHRARMSKLLTAIAGRSPFTIVFAGDELLKADFESDVDDRTSKWIEGRILRYYSHATEAVEIDSICEYIRKHQSMCFATRRKYFKE